MLKKPSSVATLRNLALCLAALSIAVPSTGAVTAAPQDEEERTLWRQFKDERPTKQKLSTPNSKRKAGKASKPKVSRDPKYKPVPVPKTDTAKVPADAKRKTVGVTIWQLRPTKSTDEARLLVHPPTDNVKYVELTPERVSAEAPLEQGSLVRLTIEAKETGYLYVVDRERYRDGSTSDAYLIFPTSHLNKGQNYVEAGTTIEIPGQSDEPTYFKLTRNSSKQGIVQISEDVTIIISPEPLAEVQIKEKAYVLDAKLFKGWEDKWQTAIVAHLEDVNGVGASYTAAEKEAGSDPTVALTQDAGVAPQSLYQLALAGDALMFTVPLPLKSEEQAAVSNQTTSVAKTPGTALAPTPPDKGGKKDAVRVRNSNRRRSR